MEQRPRATQEAKADAGKFCGATRWVSRPRGLAQTLKYSLLSYNYCLALTSGIAGGKYLIGFLVP